MPQVIFPRPFQELDLRDQHWLQPPAVLHFRCRQASTPPAALCLREISRRAILDFQPAQFLEQLLPHDRREPVAGACSVDQPVALVVPEDEGVERLRPNRVAANHKLLRAVDTHSLPGTRSQTRLVPAVDALGDQAFKSLRLHGLNEHRQTRIQRRSVSDRLGELREDLPLQQPAPGFQRLLHHIAPGQDHHIEHEVQHRRLR